MHIKTPPISILAVSPFSPALETANPPVITVSYHGLNDALAKLTPTMDIPVDKTLCPDGSVSITIKKMADFRPGNICKNVSFLQELHKAKTFIENRNPLEKLSTEFPRVAGLITIPATTETGKESSSANVIDDILSMVDTDSNENAPHSSGSPDVTKQITEIHSKILQSIFANPDFRLMEAAWHGAGLIAAQLPSDTDQIIQLTIVPLPKGDCIPVYDMLEKALADTPPDIILIDSPLGNTPRDMVVLERIMDFAETMLAPAAVPLKAGFFEIADWNHLDSAGFIPGRLEGPEYGRWKTLTGRTGAGWIVPCIGRVMARPIYRPEKGYSDPGFSESTPLWAEAPWAIGALCAKSIALHDRPTLLADRSTVRLEGLPLNDGPSPSPLELMLDTGRLADFKQAGILPLAGTPGRDHLFITGTTTMDGGPLNLRLFLSQLTGFLIRMSQINRDEFTDLEADLCKAISLFIQGLGLEKPQDLKIKAGDAEDGSKPLEISFTPAPEILPGRHVFSFGFSW